ncbi:Uncharacterized protein LSUE1_G010029 [Lachnellula suecica]|uniref:Uncharacterized protein n=1 Tax=Lachnellula suecica TaxID=602035 RepID=A0A8T9BS54_9HELO|nr:Uncharacterized protein LSUE1_G010029 [Lachnellula suecica]
MLLRYILALSCFSASSLALQGQVPLSPAGGNNGPNIASTRENGPRIFNALHSAARQWGSSLKHNGMSFFPARIPANTALYHGTHTSEPVKGMEWLAFEIEHAEMFARSKFGRGPGGGRPGGPGRGPPNSEHAGLSSDAISSKEDENNQPSNSRSYAPPPMQAAYLHTYRTSRELSRLLYIDGMSAGKTTMGTLDSQDIVLRNGSEATEFHGETQRAKELCALGVEWGIEGFVRMEAGFELILCNFTDGGLDFVSALQRPGNDQPEAYDELSQFEFMRGLAARYQGITAGRLSLDYSSMVSAFFYPLNLTNPDESRPELPRLESSEDKGIARLRSDLRHVLSVESLESHETIDWQGVVDMIVTRYTDRLQFIVSEHTTRKEVQSEMNFLLTHFVDYKDTDITAAKKTCTTHYLNSVVPRTAQDHLIYEAIRAVSQEICNTLFEVREIILRQEDSASFGNNPKAPVEQLISYLDWTTWLECVCSLAIWPWGSAEDHYNPSCMSTNETAGRRGYWVGGPGPPLPPGHHH